MENNYIERMVQICFVKQYSYVKRVEHLFSFAEKKETLSSRLLANAPHGTT